MTRRQIALALALVVLALGGVFLANESAEAIPNYIGIAGQTPGFPVGSCGYFAEVWFGASCIYPNSGGYSAFAQTLSECQMELGRLRLRAEDPFDGRCNYNDYSANCVPAKYCYK